MKVPRSMDDFDKGNGDGNGSSNDGIPPDSLPVQAPQGRALSTEVRTQALSVDVRQPGLEAEPEADGIDLRRIWAIVLKRRWTVLAFVTIVVGAVATATMLTIPLYRASA